MRGSMSKEVVIASNIVPDRIANIAAKARTSIVCLFQLLVTGTRRFDAKVSRTRRDRGYSLTRILASPAKKSGFL
jgi:hypothetical protein